MSGPRIIRAVYDLAERHDQPPTADEVAEHLEMDKDEVLEELRELQRQRIFRERRRRPTRVRVWVPWS